MSILRPGLLEESDPFNLRGIKNSWAWRRLKNLFARQVERVVEESQGGIRPEDQDTLDREIENVRSMPHEGPINALSEDRLPEFERGCQRLQSSINRVSSLVATNQPDLQRYIKIATKRDEKDLQRTLTRAQTVNHRPPVAQLQLHDMDKPYEGPHLIPCRYRKVSEVMYWLIQEPKLRNPDGEFSPDLWYRRENGHVWSGEGGKGLRWIYLAGCAKIEESVTALDFVNIAGRKDYIVASVEEDHQEIPVPIEIPRYNDGDCSSLGRHLANLWKSRRIILARRIDEQTDVDILGISFDHSNFTPRENELFLRCARLVQD